MQIPNQSIKITGSVKGPTANAISSDDGTVTVSYENMRDIKDTHGFTDSELEGRLSSNCGEKRASEIIKKFAELDAKLRKSETI